MKKLLNKISGVFKKNNNEKNISQVNVQEMCRYAKGELASYCDNEILNYR